MSQQATAPLDISDLEQVASNEVAMANRLRKLGWATTHQFFTHTVYYAGNRKTGLKRIGVTVFQPHIAPCAHTHYALPLK
jgi:hypothetical protein